MIHDILENSLMSKNLLIIGIIVIVLAISGVVSYFFLFKGKTSSDDIVTSLPGISLKEEVKGDLNYTDDAGFSFSYPKGVKVEDVTPDDETFYTKLDLIKGSSKLTISAQDSKVKSVEDWLSTSEYKGASLVGAGTLGEISAKTYSRDDKLLVVAIDQGVLYLIEGPKNEGFWEEVNGIVTSSFAFAGTKTAAVGEDSIYEEEEVVE